MTIATTNAALEIFERWHEAHESRNLDRLAAVLAEDVAVHSLFRAEPVRGRRQAIEHFSRTTTTFSGLAMSLTAQPAAANGVVFAEVQFTGAFTGELSWGGVRHRGAGEQFQVFGVVVTHVRGDEVTSVRTLFDRDVWLRQIGVLAAVSGPTRIRPLNPPEGAEQMITKLSPRVDVTQYAGKETLVRLVSQEFKDCFDMLVEANDEEWHAQTPCELWEVRDMAGHLLDAAYGYLGYFRLGEHGWPTEPPRGMRAYGDALGISALEYRKVYRWEVLGRLDACAALLFDYFDRLTEKQWSAPVPHAWVGPVPGYLMAAFQLMDYSVHAWDLRKALGKPDYVGQEASETLVPFMFGLMQITFAPERAEGVDLTVGIHISTSKDEHWTVRVRDGALTYEPGKPKKPDASFSFPCHEFCLDVYQRTQGGTAFGDKKAIRQFRKLFFTI